MWLSHNSKQTGTWTCDCHVTKKPLRIKLWYVVAVTITKCQHLKARKVRFCVLWVNCRFCGLFKSKLEILRLWPHFQVIQAHDLFIDLFLILREFLGLDLHLLSCRLKTPNKPTAQRPQTDRHEQARNFYLLQQSLQSRRITFIFAKMWFYTFTKSDSEKKNNS